MQRVGLSLLALMLTVSSSGAQDYTVVIEAGRPCGHENDGDSESVSEHCKGSARFAFIHMPAHNGFGVWEAEIRHLRTQRSYPGFYFDGGNVYVEAPAEETKDRLLVGSLLSGYSGRHDNALGALLIGARAASVERSTAYNGVISDGYSSAKFVGVGPQLGFRLSTSLTQTIRVTAEGRMAMLFGQQTMRDRFVWADTGVLASSMSGSYIDREINVEGAVMIDWRPSQTAVTFGIGVRVEHWNSFPGYTDDQRQGRSFITPFVSLALPLD